MPAEFDSSLEAAIARKFGPERAGWRLIRKGAVLALGRMFLDHVLQANDGCDFDFLRGGTPVRAEDTAGPSHA